jgi:hypothetical protein
VPWSKRNGIKSFYLQPPERLEKEATIERFRGSARLLLATEAGSEGRIGRLSRIGQKHDVHVFNMGSGPPPASPTSRPW